MESILFKKIIPPDLRESRGSRPLECRSNRTSSSRLNGELYSALELINLKLTWTIGRWVPPWRASSASSSTTTDLAIVSGTRTVDGLPHSLLSRSKVSVIVNFGIWTLFLQSFLHLHRLDHWFPKQLEEIRRIKLSRVICDNSDKIEDIQVHSRSRKFEPQHSDRAPGVRDGAPWPRDQPTGAVHLQPATQDRPDQVFKTKRVGIIADQKTEI